MGPVKTLCPCKKNYIRYASSDTKNFHFQAKQASIIYINIYYDRRKQVIKIFIEIEKVRYPHNKTIWKKSAMGMCTIVGNNKKYEARWATSCAVAM